MLNISLAVIIIHLWISDIDIKRCRNNITCPSYFQASNFIVCVDIEIEKKKKKGKEEKMKEARPQAAAVSPTDSRQQLDL